MLERKWWAQTEAHRPQTDCQILFKPACHTASGIKPQVREQSDHCMAPDPTESLLLSYQQAWVSPRDGVVETLLKAMTLTLEMLFSNVVFRKFLLESLLIATDTAAVFIRRMEWIRLQWHLKPFFNVCSWSFKHFLAVNSSSSLWV